MTLLILILWCLSVAYQFAKSNGDKILAGLPINHQAEFIARAILCGLAVFILAFWTYHYWLSVLCFCGVAYGSFTPTFRWMLNRRRGLDWRYIAPWSNAYDHFMWTLTQLGDTRPWYWEDLKVEYFEGKPEWTAPIHTAGTLAYMVEGAVLAASSLAFFFETTTVATHL